MNDSWKAQFQPRILERGSTCHQLGMVKRLNHRGSEVSALVEGTRDYRVSIRFSGGAPQEATCTCPYASDGARCKHQAAVLFALEALDYDPTPGPEDISWDQALEVLPEKVLRVMVRNLAEADPNLQQLLLLLHEQLSRTQ